MNASYLFPTWNRHESGSGHSLPREGRKDRDCTQCSQQGELTHQDTRLFPTTQDYSIPRKGTHGRERTRTLITCRHQSQGRIRMGLPNLGKMSAPSHGSRHMGYSQFCFWSYRGGDTGQQNTPRSAMSYHELPIYGELGDHPKPFYHGIHTT